LVNKYDDDDDDLNNVFHQVNELPGMRYR